MDTNALTKRLARTGGLACITSGGFLSVLAVRDALNGVPGTTLDAAIYAAVFCFGGMIFYWSQKS